MLAHRPTQVHAILFTFFLDEKGAGEKDPRLDFPCTLKLRSA